MNPSLRHSESILCLGDFLAKVFGKETLASLASITEIPELIHKDYTCAHVRKLLLSRLRMHHSQFSFDRRNHEFGVSIGIRPGPPATMEFKKGESEKRQSGRASGCSVPKGRERARTADPTVNSPGIPITSSGSTQLAHSRDKGTADSFGIRI